MQQCRWMLRCPAMTLGIVLATIGIACLTAALADAEGAQHPTSGHATLDRRQTVSPAPAQSLPPAAAVRQPESRRGKTGKLALPQAADTADFSRSGASRRFLYGTSAAARKRTWTEAQTGTPRTYVAAHVPAEFQMGGAMSPNP